ncbi:MAG TPA: ABC transporter permease [Bordetella sp.]
MQRKYNLAQSFLLTPVVLLYGLAAVAPLLVIIELSLQKGLATYLEVIASPLFFKTAINTLAISIETTVAAVVLGYLVSALLVQAKGGWRVLIMAMVLLPFWTSALIKNFAWAALLQDNGVINGLLMRLGLVTQPLTLLHTRFAVVVGMVHYVIPYAVFPIYSAMLAIDPALYRAAQSMGASRLSSSTHITLPLTRPGLYAAFLLVFIISIGFYITPIVLGSPRDMMVANLVDFYTHQLIDFSSASALAIVILVVTAFFIALYNSIPKEGQYGKI